MLWCLARRNRGRMEDKVVEGQWGPSGPCSLGLVRSRPLRAELQLRTWAAAAPQRVSTPPHPALDGQPKPWSPTQQSGEWTTGSAQFPLRPASSQASTGSVGSEGLHGGMGPEQGITQ